MMANVNLSEEVKDILSQSTITETSVILPPKQLDRKLYEQVNKALTNAGGKWNTKARAHLFTSDPRPKLGLALESGIVVDEKKLYQAFFAPKDLARRLAQKADVRGKGVLEPSAGRGAIADACMEEGAKFVSCVDINPENVAYLKAKGYPTKEADFLDLLPIGSYDCVVMNPPFTKNQDIKHVNHAAKFVRPGGVLVAVMMANENRKGFDDLTSRAFYEMEWLPRGTFKESGTDVETMILTLMFDDALIP